MRRPIGEPIPLKHGYLLEMSRQRASGRQAAHASSDHQGVPAQDVGHCLQLQVSRKKAPSRSV
jgi:hypothetical protein